MSRKATMRELDVAIIGLGNWGTSLGHALLQAKVPVREVIVRRAPRRGVRLPLTTWDRARLDARVIWLCVPDGSIQEAAFELATRTSLRGQTVVHSSGALTVDVLAAAKRAGAAVAAVHPVMTFPTRRAVSVEGVPFGIEAPSPGARRLLMGLVRRMGGRTFEIAGRRKALYHAAGTMASPLLVSAVAAAAEIARAAGLSSRDAMAVVQALSEATLHNIFARGARNSFSGPFARGDAETVKLHLQALAGHPILADVYRSLARYAIESLPVRNPRELALSVAFQKEQSPHPAGKRKASPAV